KPGELGLSETARCLYWGGFATQRGTSPLTTKCVDTYVHRRQASSQRKTAWRFLFGHSSKARHSQWRAVSQV
ncbi:hypothetical protein, partial [Pseudomonas sp. SWRI18]|uniref:hypothetical protein n=1 Tax=Pseudomonas sp. SWRI18 TaxID=2753888 RepID=UPI001EE1D8EA